MLPPGAPDAKAIAALVQRLQDEGRALTSALRVARQVCLERLATLDIEQGASLHTVTASMTALAECTLELALADAQAGLGARYGEPVTPEGKLIEFWIVGMGKLGARELNVSSDIDLIYVYEEEGQTNGPQAISAHE
jgi:glutamate-ammonia-ligase adenylyltransferase